MEIGDRIMFEMDDCLRIGIIESKIGWCQPYRDPICMPDYELRIKLEGGYYHIYPHEATPVPDHITKGIDMIKHYETMQTLYPRKYEAEVVRLLVIGDFKYMEDGV